MKYHLSPNIYLKGSYYVKIGAILQIKKVYKKKKKILLQNQYILAYAQNQKYNANNQVTNCWSESVFKSLLISIIIYKRKLFILIIITLRFVLYLTIRKCRIQKKKNPNT